MMNILLLPIDKPDANKLDEAYELGADAASAAGTRPIVVPKCFQYDGASIPSPAWQLIGTPFSPRLMVAALFHDWIYHVHTVSKDEADDLFERLLVASGISKTRAGLMKSAVAVFGAAYWENDAGDVAYMRRLKKRIVDEGRDPATYGL